MIAPQLNLDKILIRAKGCHPGYEKRNGVKTDKPLVDAQTGNSIYWISAVAFPENSAGGEDVPILIKCPSATTPLTLASGERPLVKLITPRVEITERGMMLAVDGVERIKEGK